MKPRAAFVFAAVLAIAGQAFAQFSTYGTLDDSYNAQLKARAMTQPDQDFCNKWFSKEMDGCTVTRNYLVDIAAGADAGKGYPRQANPRYRRTNAEQDILAQKLHANGGA